MTKTAEQFPGTGTAEYDAFIATKSKSAADDGFDPPLPLNPSLFDWQKLVVKWALKKGRSALFAECGLGKTLMQAEWARQVVAETGKAVLILCPLAVAKQTVREGVKFGIEINHARQASEVKLGAINITNYDRIQLFDPSEFVGVVLDESSIIKGYNGKTRQLLNAAFGETPYKLCCTATPSPNDYTELGQHADFLGVCTPAQMLCTYFINDTFNTGDWRLKKHAVELFWEWVSSWAACVSRPGDLGFSNEGYDLPRVHTEIITVNVDHKSEKEGELFVNPNVSATDFHAEQRRTAADRIAAAAKIVNASTGPFIVWCESNDESAALAKAISGAVEVVGADKAEDKEEKLNAFTFGQVRVIVTKASIAGFGMNWQHCNQEIYVGMNHSFERFYQASKRIHRFGQKAEVRRYIVQADTENGVMANIAKKADQHNQMRELMKFTKENLTNPKKITVLNTELIKAEKGNWTLYNGDCVRVAKTIESDSVGFSVFSPPFADLFTYSSDVQDMGNCSGLEEFMVQFGFLIDELLRVTMPGRECAVHCCDLLSAKWKDGEIEFKDFSSAIATAFRERGWLFHSRITIWKDPVTEMQRTKAHGLLYKTLRTDSSKSRVGAAEYLLVFRKRGENPKPITHTHTSLPLDQWQELASPVWMTIDQSRVLNGKFARSERDERHICPLQLDVIERALILWSAPDDLVFSPFTGIGSEGYCAVKMGRRFVGAELKAEYWKHACQYLEAAAVETRDLFCA